MRSVVTAAAPVAPASDDEFVGRGLQPVDRGLGQQRGSGIEALTMRKLGTALGVEATSLYRYVADKAELLDGMTDVVFGEIELPSGTDWRSAMRGRAVSSRGALSRHRWAGGLTESRARPGPVRLRHHAAMLGNPAVGGLLGCDGRPRVLGAGQLHLWVCPSGAEPAAPGG